MTLAHSLPTLVYLLLFLSSPPSPGYTCTQVCAYPVQSTVVHSRQGIQVRKRSYSCRGSCLRLRLLYPWLCYQYCYRYHIRMFRIIWSVTLIMISKIVRYSLQCEFLKIYKHVQPHAYSNHMQLIFHAHCFLWSSSF